MNIVIVSSLAVLITIVVGLAIALPMVWLSRLVAANQQELEAQKTDYNERVTLGHRIRVAAPVERQLDEARELAARRAAALPRGANMRIGRAGNSPPLRTASKGLQDDPISAVKIAQFHSWQGAATGPVEAQAAAPVSAGAAVKQVKRELVAGKDYPVIEVTDAMSPAEIRQARIANAKAKSAAYKRLKESGQDMVAAAAAPAAPTARAATAPAPVNIPPEPEYVEITDSMSPDEIRQARIANSKLRSQYNKQLKEAGIDPKTRQPIDGVAAAAPAVEAAVPPAPAAAPAVALPPEPDYIEITDEMSPDEVRQARINNSKMRSQYNKELKALGIDPQTGRPAGEVAASPAPAPAETAAAETASMAAAPRTDVPPPPDYVEITDDMSPEEKRDARINNSRLRSEYNKQLKALGIDPKSLN